jgi:hypothetical protein
VGGQTSFFMKISLKNLVKEKEAIIKHLKDNTSETEKDETIKLMVEAQTDREVFQALFRGGWLRVNHWGDMWIEIEELVNLKHTDLSEFYVDLLERYCYVPFAEKPIRAIIDLHRRVVAKDMPQLPEWHNAMWYAVVEHRLVISELSDGPSALQGRAVDLAIGAATRIYHPQIRDFRQETAIETMWEVLNSVWWLGIVSSERYVEQFNIDTKQANITDFELRGRLFDFLQKITA